MRYRKLTCGFGFSCTAVDDIRIAIESFPAVANISTDLRIPAFAVVTNARIVGSVLHGAFTVPLVGDSPGQVDWILIPS